MDADGDSSVSLDEGLAYVKSHRLKMSVSNSLPIFQNMDTDKDGHPIPLGIPVPKSG